MINIATDTKVDYKIIRVQKDTSRPKNSGLQQNTSDTAESMKVKSSAQRKQQTSEKQIRKLSSASSRSNTSKRSLRASRR